MKRLIIGIFILTLLLNVVACTKTVEVYVCANGKREMDPNACPTNKVAGVNKKDAESYARNYVNAYFTAMGGRAQMVSSYLNPDQGDYLATFVVSEKDGDPYETVVVVDGKTGQVKCSENCGYAGGTETKTTK